MTWLDDVASTKSIRAHRWWRGKYTRNYCWRVLLTGLITCRMTVQNCWRGCWLADDLAGQPGSVAGIRARKTRGVRGAHGQCCRQSVWARAGIQDACGRVGRVSYWFLLITQRNNTNKEEEKTILNSTLHAQALHCSLSFLSVFSLFSATISQLFNEYIYIYIYTQMGVKGHKSCHDLCHRLCPPPCVKWEIRYSHLHMVGHCLSPFTTKKCIN